MMRKTRKKLYNLVQSKNRIDQKNEFNDYYIGQEQTVGI